MAAVGELPPQIVNRVCKEMLQIRNSEIEGITVCLNEENVTDIQAEIVGPVGTPYEGGVFRMKLILDKDFPQAPPRGYFLTKLFHPNVAANGEICVNTLKKDWKPELGIKHVLMVVRCLLIEPNPESALNEEAGKLLLEDFDDFAKHARLMTSIHAAKKENQENTDDNASNSKENSSGNSPNSMKKRGVDAKKLDKKQLEKKRSLKRL